MKISGRRCLVLLPKKWILLIIATADFLLLAFFIAMETIDRNLPVTIKALKLH